LTPALGFRPDLERVDAVLLAAARRRNERIAEGARDSGGA
jgi:hypothetical protein